MKNLLRTAIGVGISMLLGGGAFGQEIEVDLYQRLTSLTALYMNPSNPVPGAVGGFSYTREITVGPGGPSLGTESGEILFSDPPFDPGAAAQHASMIGSFVIPGLGSLQFKGYLVGLGGAEAEASGELLCTYFGSYGGGSGLLGGWTALGTGAGRIRFRAPEGELPYKMAFSPPVALPGPTPEVSPTPTPTAAPTPTPGEGCPPEVVDFRPTGFIENNLPVVSATIRSLCGTSIDRSSIQLTINGTAFSPTITGGGAEVAIAYTFQSAIPDDTAMDVVLKARDANGNAVEKAWRFSLRPYWQ
jgi:hypothetical protein